MLVSEKIKLMLHTNNLKKKKIFYYITAFLCSIFFFLQDYFCYQLLLLLFSHVLINVNYYENQFQLNEHQV